ncbi:MAG: hypothetical protein EA376_02590 [Phycisphaeraceae bacterium]|nr:MAG: hypothetical protein EA376_02590 [Phycisphaeraceae bacterium]
MSGAGADSAREIFDRAVELDAEGRRRLLDERCAGNMALRAEVEELLRCDDEMSTGFLGADAGAVAAASGLIPSEDDDVGATIGRYRLIRRLGAGGFGVVYLAEQTEPVRRSVALKVIKLGMDTRSVVARFEAERQALAMMDHPHVARVYDAGATAQGRPYFVMEHVPGVPITAHCDGSRLDVESRLRLFMQVCGAVQHAHQKGIIHRDLKPSNIMVTEVDDDAEVKVIDFGVAKAIDTTGAGMTRFTEMGQVVGTPEYMSPEQAGAAGTGMDVVDTRTDIYSLGVVLYELITGAPPFESQSLRPGGLLELQRRIREDEAPRPSVRASSLGDSAAEAAALRRLEPAEHRRLLRGDLDWIVMRAMEKDPARRYASASELSQDLERHLSSEPVLARPPSAGYRASKFVRRHRAGVAAATVAALAMLAGAAALTVGMVRAVSAEASAREARDAEIEQRRLAEARLIEAEEARRRAAQAAEETEAVNAFLLNDLLASVRPEEARGRNVTVAEALGNAAERVGDAFRDQPALEATVRNAIGNTYRSLSDYESAVMHLRAALELRRKVEPVDLNQVSFAANNLAIVLRQLGRLDEAIELYHEAMELRRAQTDGYDADLVALLHNYSAALLTLNRWEDAEQVVLESVDGHLEVFGEEHAATGMTYTNMGRVLRGMGRHEEAIEWFSRSVTIMRSVHGDDHPATGTAVNFLGTAYLQSGMNEEAVPLLEECIEIYRRVLGPEHISLGIAMQHLGDAYLRMQRYEDAAPFLHESHRIAHSSLPPDHTIARGADYYLGQLKSATSLYEEAEGLFLQCYSLTPEQRYDTRADLALSLTTLYERWEREEEASRWRERIEHYERLQAGGTEGDS